MVEADRTLAARHRQILRRSLSVSIILECAVVAVALVWPLLYPAQLAAKRYVFIPIPPYGPPRSLQASHAATSQPRDRGVRIITPTTLLLHSPTSPVHRDQTIAVDTFGAVSGIGPSVGAADIGGPEGLISLGDTRPPTAPPLHPAQPERSAAPPIVRRSEGVQAALLIRRVEPAYPPLGRQLRIQGTVQIRAIISREGSIDSLHALSGHPLLVTAALDAVRQWRYRPTLLGTEPVEVETYITVIFKLGDN